MPELIKPGKLCNNRGVVSGNEYAPPSFDTIQHELVGFTHIYCVNRLCKHYCRDDKYGCDTYGMGLDNDPCPCPEYIDYKKFYKDEYDAYVATEEEKRQKRYNDNVGSGI